MNTHSLSTANEGQILDTRERILEAAERVMREKGFARATTKEIARAAQCSEGNLYNHFENKQAIFMAVMTERLPGFVPLIKTLHERVGVGTVRQNLEEVVRTAIAFYGQLIPISSAMMSNPGMREGIRSRGAGPHRANEGLAAYIRREQSINRVHEEVDPEAAAALLLGACQQRAMHRLFLGDSGTSSSDDEFASALVATLLRGLSPAVE
jgi:AcrR family transcriptional regulator